MERCRRTPTSLQILIETASLGEETVCGAESGANLRADRLHGNDRQQGNQHHEHSVFEQRGAFFAAPEPPGQSKNAVHSILQCRFRRPSRPIRVRITSEKAMVRRAAAEVLAGMHRSLAAANLECPGAGRVPSAVTGITRTASVARSPTRSPGDNPGEAGELQQVLDGAHRMQRRGTQ